MLAPPEKLREMIEREQNCGTQDSLITRNWVNISSYEFKWDSILQVQVCFDIASFGTANAMSYDYLTESYFG